MYVVCSGMRAVCSGMHAVWSGMHAVCSGMHAVWSGMHAVCSGMHAVWSGMHAVWSAKPALLNLATFTPQLQVASMKCVCVCAHVSIVYACVRAVYLIRLV